MPKRKSADKPSSSPPTAEEVLTRIASLPEQEAFRLGQMLLERSRPSTRLLPGHAIITEANFHTLLTLGYHFLNRTITAEELLGKAMPLLEELRRFAGHLLRTRQPKRGPTNETLQKVERIRQARAAGRKWRLIDRDEGLTPGTARTLFYRANKNRENQD
jgi:hypothetical protein